MKVYNTKKEAVIAIGRYANIVRNAEKELSACFFADASDDSGMEYYVEASYRNSAGKVLTTKVCFQDLNL